ncbi:hypothetical protein ENUP19_0136G0017 [Entamoeba nuttalli]|uniref:Ras modification protein ERF4 n=1 Tax=Entamoeba nuttalli TaxID=412467 RepID=A0ABQ0DK08_9EUKA
MQTPQYQIVSIDRDYSKGLTPRFFTTLPPQLTGLIEKNEFERIITQINQYFIEAENITWKTIIEESCSCLSCGLTNCCFKNQYHRKMIELQEYLIQLNRKFPSLQFIHPINNGFLCFEISIFSSQE